MGRGQVQDSQAGTSSQAGQTTISIDSLGI